MQPNKSTKRNSELEHHFSNSEKLTSSLTDVMNKFQVKKNAQIFDVLKSKGIAVSSIFCMLMILPFYGYANICQLMKYGLNKLNFEGKKTTFYDCKNNEMIDWRMLLISHAKRFMYLINNNINLKSTKIKAFIFDDTNIEKTGRKIEKVGMIHDHVLQRFILGYKLLVCGIWDGASFIPLDFSLHREKGRRHEKLINEHYTISKLIKKQKKELAVVEEKCLAIQSKLLERQDKLTTKPNKTNQLSYEKSLSKSIKLAHKKAELQKQINKTLALKKEAYAKLKHYYSSDCLYGLSYKERKEQFKKAVSTKSHGFLRRKETGKSKIDSMLLMLGRVVKAGITADYVLVDSWYFCYELLKKLNHLNKGAIKLVSMVKINNQKFTLCLTGKEMSAKAILKTTESKKQRCRKYKADYIRVNCLYKDIRVNIFFVRMGRSQNWHLLLTTDLELSFVKLMEIYQIRWSIEVFFKESKQYLKLSDCSSNTFDAQIADITISMMQNIMLSYFKRVNYQQSIGGLFKDISDEIVEIDLVSRLSEIFIELVEILCEISGIDFIEFQKDVIKNDKIMQKFQTLIPEKIIDKVA